MITRYKFRIGDIVLVKGELIVEKEPGSWGEIRRIKRRVLAEGNWYRAVISGAGTRCEGVGVWDEDGRYFKTSQVVPVWLVRPAVCSAERPVFEEDLTLVSPFARYEYPLTGSESSRTRWRGPVPWKISGTPMTDHGRQLMRDVMADWPRDEKGHWRKMPDDQAFSSWLKGQDTDPEIGELARTVKEENWSFWYLFDLRRQIKARGKPRLEQPAVRAWNQWFEKEGR